MFERISNQRVGLIFAVAVLLVAAISSPLAADVPSDPALLTDLNTTIHVDSQSDAGITSWTVNGVSQLNREWFWYRVGPANSTNPEKSIDTLTRITNKITDANDNPGYDTLFQKFSSGDGWFTIAVTYNVTNCGAVGTSHSDMGLAVTITNTSSQTLDFHFFQLMDFDLNGTAGGDNAKVTNANCVDQWESYHLAETVFGPVPTTVQLAYDQSIYDLLADTKGDDLTSTLGPVGPGNVEYSLQWDITLVPGGNFGFSENQLLGSVPEPATLSLLLIGGTAALIRRRRTA
jgi:hypothetical protein